MASNDDKHKDKKHKKDGHGGGGARAKAARRNIEQADTILQQAHALHIALGKHGLRHELGIQLGNTKLAERQTDQEIMRGYGERLASLDQSAADNEKSQAGQSFANLSNAARERANAISEAMANGAGESDILRAQQMSLRNFNANQNDVNRSFFDTQSSINASLNDLNADTRTARVNNAIQSQADRNQLFTDYYSRRSETMTQLGNTLGQAADYLSLANEAKSTKKTRRRQKRLAEASGEAFDDAATEIGKAHKSPGVGRRLTGFTGAAHFESALNTGALAGTSTDLSKPEGATLRRFP